MFKALAKYWLFIVSSLILLGVIGFLGMYFLAYRGEDTVAEINGRVDFDFRVFYLDNDIFEENPIPRNLHFLMSFTDFIEIDSGFTARFHEDILIFYEYTATERLVIRYMATVDGNVNPIVYEELHILSEESGQTVASGLTFPSIFFPPADGVRHTASGSGPGGTYIIDPRPHIDRYLEFVSVQARQMYEENLLVRGGVSFSAELFVDFTYMIYIPALNFRQTLDHGYRFSLSTEIYSLIATNGNASFDEAISLIVRELPFEFSLPVITIFVLSLVLCAYSFFVGVKRLRVHTNERVQEVIDILKKYANEIVVSNNPIGIADYNLAPVDEFEELLKLAINLNKHIMCYKDSDYAIFVVIVDNYAYNYTVNFHTNTPDYDIQAYNDILDSIEEMLAVEDLE